MKIIDYLNNKERYIIQNITLIAVILIIIILLIDISPHIINLIYDTKYNFISTQFTLTTIWWIFAFWYWYKKYERDKELEMIKLFDITNNEKLNFNEWKILFDLNEKWKIPEYLYEIVREKYSNWMILFLDKFDEDKWRDFAMNNISTKSDFKKYIVLEVKSYLFISDKKLKNNIKKVLKIINN